MSWHEASLTRQRPCRPRSRGRTSVTVATGPGRGADSVSDAGPSTKKKEAPSFCPFAPGETFLVAKVSREHQGGGSQPAAGNFPVNGAAGPLASRVMIARQSLRQSRARAPAAMLCAPGRGPRPHSPNRFVDSEDSHHRHSEAGQLQVGWPPANPSHVGSCRSSTALSPESRTARARAGSPPGPLGAAQAQRSGGRAQDKGYGKKRER